MRDRKIYGYGDPIFTGDFTGFRAFLTARFRDAQRLLCTLSTGDKMDIW